MDYNINNVINQNIDNNKMIRGERRNAICMKKFLISLLIILGCIGVGLSLYDNKDSIKESVSADTNMGVSTKSQSEFNLFLQNEITPVKQSVNEIIQQRKQNSAFNRATLQDKITTATNNISNAIDNVNNQSVSETQTPAKEGVITCLNKIKYNLILLEQASEKDDFTPTNKDVNEYYSKITSYCSELNNYIGIGETVK